MLTVKKLMNLLASCEQSPKNVRVCTRHLVLLRYPIAPTSACRRDMARQLMLWDDYGAGRIAGEYYPGIVLLTQQAPESQPFA